MGCMPELDAFTTQSFLQEYKVLCRRYGMAIDICECGNHVVLGVLSKEEEIGYFQEIIQSLPMSSESENDNEQE